MSAIHFCEEIEEFVALLSIQEWWNHGRSELAVCTHNHLVLHSIPQQTGAMGMTRWRTNIHAMICQIPSIASSQGSRCLTRHFHIIGTILSDYECCQADIAPLLMLGLWKWNMSIIIADGYTCDSVNFDEMKLKSRYACSGPTKPQSKCQSRLRVRAFRVQGVSRFSRSPFLMIHCQS